MEKLEAAATPLARDPLFHARSVAIVGASAKLGTIGGRPVKYLLAYGFSGDIFPINPKYEEICGLKAYPSLHDVPVEIDMAIIAVPARSVAAAIEDCAAKGVKVAVVFSSGYAEVGADGVDGQAALAQQARRCGLRLLGPNAMGLMNLHNGLMATFSAVLEREHRAGPLGLVSQSGAYGAYIMAQGRELGLGFSQFSSSGNEADLEFGELALRTLEDEGTGAVLGYIEQIRDGDAFLQACRRSLELAKPLVIIKVGRSEQGALAAQSHTGALAGSHATYAAVFEQFGALSVDSVDEMLDIAQMIQFDCRPKGSRMGILSISGGAGVLLVDACEEAGLQAPTLPESVQERLRSHVPFAGVANPVDFTPTVLSNPDVYAKFLEALCEQENIDTLIIFLAHTIQYEQKLGLRLVEETVRAKQRFGKPIVVVAQPGKDTEVAKALQDGGIPCFMDPSRTVRAVAALQRFYARRDTLLQCHPQQSVAANISVAEVATEQASKCFLAEHGLRVTREVVVGSRDEACARAAEIGYPVVLKLSSPDVPHKSDIGGVRLNLLDEAAVAEAYDAILAAAAEHAADSRVDGILVQEMVAQGIELIIGAKQDPVFGPVVLCGLGGVYTEVLRDFSMRRAPIDRATALQMLAGLRGRALLEGVRGSAAVDLEGAAEAIVAVSRIAAGARDWVAELDLNPVILLPAGQGYRVADAYIRTGEV